MIKKLICIECPKGCVMTVEFENNKFKSVSGNKCPKGEAYALLEIENPERVLTSTVLSDGLRVRMVPVKTDRPIPKELLFKAMEEVKRVRLKKPVKVGSVIIENLLDTGADLVATREVDFA